METSQKLIIIPQIPNDYKLRAIENVYGILVFIYELYNIIHKLYIITSYIIQYLISILVNKLQKSVFIIM